MRHCLAWRWSALSAPAPRPARTSTGRTTARSTLKLGPDYDNAVITATREELGAAVRARTRSRSRASTITVLTVNSRPQGRHLRPAPRVPADLGGAVRRQAQHRRAAVRRALHQDDARSPQRHRRVRRVHGRRVLVWRHRAGRLHAYPIDELMAVGRVPAVDLRRRCRRRCKTLHHWGDVGYGVLNDADGQVLYYRRDVLDQPRAPGGVQGASTATTCRRRRKTWQQLLDIAQLLQRQELGRQRRRAGQRHGPAPQGRRAGPLPLPVALGARSRSRRATRSTSTTTSTGSTRPT